MAVKTQAMESRLIGLVYSHVRPITNVPRPEMFVAVNIVLFLLPEPSSFAFCGYGHPNVF
jgi:hypothetical protein